MDSKPESLFVAILEIRDTLDVLLGRGKPISTDDMQRLITLALRPSEQPAVPSYWDYWRVLDSERKYHDLLAVLRQRDRLMMDRQLLSSDEVPADMRQWWEKRHWKEQARNQLALTAAVRPLLLSDYRSRVRALSPTYGQAGTRLRALHDRQAYLSAQAVEAESAAQDELWLLEAIAAGAIVVFPL
jgi:hypothetical protein